MNAIIGYVRDRKFPRLSGPCKGCGATDYGLSTSGPDYCGACACGVNPELTKLRTEYRTLSAKYCDALLALSHLTGHKPPSKINAKCQWRAEEFIRRFKREENLLIGFGPDIKDLPPTDIT